MNTLIIDCSSGMSVYVLADEKIYSKIDKNQKRHTDELLCVVDELLKNAGIKIQDINNLCVCIGPGSFTGIRVAISVVKGLAVESNAKVFALTNFDIFQNVDDKNSVYVLDGFSKFVYARFVFNGETFDECIDTEGLTNKLKECDINIFVENEKVQNVLKNAEIKSNIAQNSIILRFLEKINNNNQINLNTIEPVYLRASQAEIERNKKLQGEK